MSLTKILFYILFLFIPVSLFGIDVKIENPRLDLDTGDGYGNNVIAVHSKLTVSGIKGENFDLVAIVQDDLGNWHVDSYGNTVKTHYTVNAPYEVTEWNDISVFLKHSNLSPKPGRHTYKIFLYVYYKNEWYGGVYAGAYDLTGQVSSSSPYIEMVYVEGGSFMMGATPEQELDYWDDEKPVHHVRLSNYYIGKYEVTQAQWEMVMGTNPSYFRGPNLPVDNVSWDDVQEFIRRLNAMTGKSYRLPTEAEWEYAARGGNKRLGYKYSGSNDVESVAWYSGNSGFETHPVGTKAANELGIHDMSGNVYEWCSDWYGDYSDGSQTNPRGPSSGSFRVLRGGSWFDDSWLDDSWYYDDADFWRVSYRNGDSPDSEDIIFGFRLAASFL